MTEFGFGRFMSFTKSLNRWIKEPGVMFKSIDDIIKNAATLCLKCGRGNDGGRQFISQPVMVTLENPLLRFSCLPEMKKFIAKSIAESIYALSGMNGSDFIWEFRGWDSLRTAARIDSESIGHPLRFWGDKTGKVLDYANSNHLRQTGTGFVDQFQKAFTHLVSSNDDFVILLRSPTVNHGVAHSAWVKKNSFGRLQMMVSCGEANVLEDLIVKIIPAFGFVQQTLSEITGIPLGSLTIAIAELYYRPNELPRVKELSKAGLPIVGGLNDFAYPASNLTLRDVDNLISMMQEFVGRLDKKSLTRANPYEGDQRVLFWSDMAECFRANKAEALGYKVESESVFYHPQLRYIYKGETI